MSNIESSLKGRRIRGTIIRCLLFDTTAFVKQSLALLSYLTTNSTNKADAQETVSLPSFFCTTSIFILFYHCIRQTTSHQVDDYYSRWEDRAQREYFNGVILSSKSTNVFSGIYCCLCIQQSYTLQFKVMAQYYHFFSWHKAGIFLVCTENVGLNLQHFCNTFAKYRPFLNPSSGKQYLILEWAEDFSFHLLC